MTDELANTPPAPADSGAALAVVPDPTPPAPPAEGGTPPTPPAEVQASNEAAKAEAPEKYELSFPEGVDLDAALFAEFEPIARELNLTNEQAQKLADFHLKHASAAVQDHQESWRKQLTAWETTVKTDKELGGPNLDASLKTAQSAVARFGSPELKAMFETTGLGSHPELVRFANAVGKAMAEDTVHSGGSGSSALAPEQVMFPTMFKQ